MDDGGTPNGRRLAVTRLNESGAIVALSTSATGMSPPDYGPCRADTAAVVAFPAPPLRRGGSTVESFA